MNDLKVYNILKGVYVTEKTSMASVSAPVYTFKVCPRATKVSVRQAIEFNFKVKVDSVNIVNVKPKLKRFKQKLGTRSGWKKAYVVLQKGQSIDLSSTVA